MNTIEKTTGRIIAPATCNVKVSDIPDTEASIVNVYEKDIFGYEPGHVVSHLDNIIENSAPLDQIKELIKKGSLSAQQNLHFVCKNDHLDTFKYLVDELKYDVKSTFRGVSVLSMAALYGSTNIVKYLCTNYNELIDCLDPFQNSAYVYAVLSGNIETLKALNETQGKVDPRISVEPKRQVTLNTRNKQGMAPVEFAAATDKSLRILRYLQLRGEFRPNALYYAVKYNNVPAAEYLIKDCEYDIGACICNEYLIEVAPSREMVTLLIKCGIMDSYPDADVIANRKMFTDNSTSRQAMWADLIERFFNDAEMIKLFEKYGCDYKSKYMGELCYRLMAHCWSQPLVEFLINKGVIFSDETQLRLLSPTSPSSADRWGGDMIYTPHPILLARLIERGCIKPTLIDGRRRTVLHLSKSWRVPNDNREQRFLSLYEYFLKNGADPNAQDCEGRTPLHYAADEKKLEVIKLLIKYGAKIDITDKDGLTVLDYTTSPEIKEYLASIQSDDSDSTKGNPK